MPGYCDVWDKVFGSTIQEHNINESLSINTCSWIRFLMMVSFSREERGWETHACNGRVEAHACARVSLV